MSSKTCASHRILRSKCKGVIILLFMNQFQQFKNLSSNLINWKFFVLILLLILKFFEFCKIMSSETCASHMLSEIKM